MNKKNLIWMIPIFSLVIVSAAWLFSVSGGFEFVVESLPGYASIDLAIPVLSVNTTDGIDNDMQSISFLINKDMTMSVTISEIYQDNSGGECLGGESDCEIRYYIENQTGVLEEIFDGRNVNLTAIRGLRTLNTTMECQAYSCPQSRSVTIDLVEVK